MKHIPRIYIPHVLSANKLLCLDKESSHHLLTVLRLKMGSAVIIFNGEGGEYSGKLINVDKKRAKVQLDKFFDTNNESPIEIELMQGIARNERMDIVMQKAVELGVCAITPVWTEYSNVKIDKAKMEKRVAHWQKIIINATEQSGRCVVATLNPPVKLKDKLNDLGGFDLKLVCHPPSPSLRPRADSDAGSNPFLKDGLPRELKFPRNDGKVLILIGPEGGLSETEVKDAEAKGFKILTLGPRILRTETAAIAALTVIQNQLGDV